MLLSSKYPDTSDDAQMQRFGLPNNAAPWRRSSRSRRSVNSRRSNAQAVFLVGDKRFRRCRGNIPNVPASFRLQARCCSRRVRRCHAPPADVAHLRRWRSSSLEEWSVVGWPIVRRTNGVREWAPHCGIASRTASILRSYANVDATGSGAAIGDIVRF